MGKISIYQVFTRLFGNLTNHTIPNGSIKENGVGKFSDFSTQALQEIKALGITHIWYTGVIEHATQTTYKGILQDHPAVVKGKAGSPYAIKDYYDVDPDLADKVADRMQEFEQLVDRTHQQDLQVIIDFVPNHVARQYHSDAKPTAIEDLGATDNTSLNFSPYNNFYYLPNSQLKDTFNPSATLGNPYIECPAKATGNNLFTTHPTINDWYETIKLNYGINYFNGNSTHFSPTPDTWIKMKDILLFWASKKVDAFRCDMAEMVPVEFWHWAITEVKKEYPALLFIAEVYDPSQYHNYIYNGLFDYLYDKVGLYDTLKGVIRGEIPATRITTCWQSLNGMENKMLNFLENHDEQRIASDFFAKEARKAIPAMLVATCLNKSPIMTYFGQEFAERGMDAEGFSGRDGRTTIFDYWSVSTIRKWINNNYHISSFPTETQAIYHSYQTILNLSQKEAAIYQGDFFDLMYVNQDGWKFNKERNYTFLRKYQNEVLLFVINFDSFPIEVAINIPSHAFDYLQIPPRDCYKAVDLLTNQAEDISLLPYKATTTSVNGWSGKVLKIIL